MFSDVKRHMLYRIGNAAVRPYPYAHLFLDGVFPQAFYEELRRRLPAASAYASLGETGRVTKGAYPERTIFAFDDRTLGRLDAGDARFWGEVGKLMLDPELMGLFAAKFDGPLQLRFAGQGGNVEVEPEAFLVRDGSGYAIGPHTDAPHRLVSALFYLPPDDRWRVHGTSIYAPKDRSFTCAGGPHYLPEPFERVATMDYVPNALFAFAKTNVSFHGVEKVEEPGIVRDLVLYDVRLKRQAARSAPPVGEAA